MSVAPNKTQQEEPQANENSEDSERVPTLRLRSRSAPARARPSSNKLATIEGYEILSELGRGGMAIVFKARQVALNRLVALKMVLGGELREPEFHLRFQMEAEAVARLQHPNIIQVFDYSTVAGMFPGETQCPYIAFEYVAGGNLGTRIGGLPQPAHQAARVVEILADAVQYAHNCGIIHRDLKPANVLMTADGVPKISDFGLAKLLDDGDMRAGLTATGTVVGTPEYMAPEQTLPNCRIGPCVDTYALGVILYELVTGRRPFEAGTVLETVKLVCNREPARPRTLQPNVPRDLETICLKCLRKEPHHRYAAAADLADDLRRFQSGQPIAAHPVGVIERGWKWARRYQSLAWLLVVLTLLVILGLPGVTLLWFSADQAKREAISKTQALVKANRDVTNKSRDAIRARDMADGLRRDSERREARLALEQGLGLCQQGQVDRGLLYLVRSLELHAPFKDGDIERALRINLTDWSQQLARPVISLDTYPRKVTAVVFLSNDTAMVANDYVVREFDIRTGKATTAPLAGPFVHDIGDPFTMILSSSLSADGKTAAFGRTNGVIQLWDSAAKKQVTPVMQQPSNVWGVAFCPVSDRIAGCHGDEAIIWDRKTGAVLVKVPHPKTTVSQVLFDPTGKKLVTSAWDGKVRVFESENGTIVHEAQVQKDRLGAMALSPDGRHLVVGGREGKAQTLSLAELKDVGMPLRHLAGVTSTAFSPDGRTIVTGANDDTARIWDATTGRMLGPPLRFAAEVNAVSISPDGRQCLVGSNDGQAQVWELPVARQQGKSMLHLHAVDSLAFAPNGNLVAGCANAVYVWNTNICERRDVLSADQMRLHNTALSPDGRVIIASRWDGSLYAWSAVSKKPPQIVPLPSAANLIAATASGHVWLACNSRRPRLTSIDLTTGQPGPHGLIDPGAVLCLAVTPSPLPLSSGGRGARGEGVTVVATGGRDFNVRLWDAATGEVLRLLPHPERLQCVAFSADGKLLATGCRDGSARIWEVSSGRLLTTTSPQQSPVLAVAFSPDGQLLATGGGDHTARFFDPATGILLGAPLWHIDAVQAVAFHPSGKYLASGCRDGAVRLWHRPAKPSTAAIGELRSLMEQLTDLQLAEDGSFRRLKS